MTRPSGSRSGRRGLAGPAAWLLIGLFGCYCLTTTLDHPTNDVISASVGAWTIAESHSPWLDGVDTDDFQRPKDLSLWIGTAENGHTAVFRSPGVIAAGVPAYVIAGQGPRPDEFSVLPGAVTASLLTSLAMVLLAFTLDRHGKRTALGAALVVALCTPVWSVAADGLWTHSVTVFALAGVAWAAHRDRWWLVGLFGGVALWGRLHTALIVAIVGLGVAVVRRRPSIALAVAVPSASLMALATLWSHWMYGSWNPAGPYGTVNDYAERAADGTLAHELFNELGMLVSPDRGLLVWTPAIIVLLPALVRSWRRIPDWSLVMALGGVVYLFAQGMLNDFDGGQGYYGYRLTLETLICLVPALVAAFKHTTSVEQLILGPVLACQFAAICLGATSNGFLVAEDRAWVDNSFWLALRTWPALWGWLILTAVVGLLATIVLRQRVSAAHVSSAEQSVQRV